MIFPLRTKAPKSVPPMAYTGPSVNDRRPPTQRMWGGRCVNFSYDSAAVLVSFLTLANGIIALVNGIQWFAAGGSLARGQDAFETAVGAIIDVMSVISIVVLYSRIKRIRFVVLAWGALYTLIPPVSLIVLGAFLAAANKNPNTLNRITQACDRAIDESPFTDVSTAQLRQVCIQQNKSYLTRTVISTFVRAALQLLLSSFIAIWTYWRVLELGHKNSSYDNPFNDGQAIPFTTHAAPLGKRDYDVIVDGGQFVNKQSYTPPYTATPYPHLQNAQGFGYQPPPYPPAAH